MTTNTHTRKGAAGPATTQGTGRDGSPCQQDGRAALQEQDMVRLRHLCGVKTGYPREFWGYRDSYKPASAADHASMGRLEQAGLVRKSGHIYRATAAGCKAAGVEAQKGLAVVGQPTMPAL